MNIGGGKMSDIDKEIEEKEKEIRNNNHWVLAYIDRIACFAERISYFNRATEQLKYEVRLLKRRKNE
jgi:hypothetical protein